MVGFELVGIGQVAGLKRVLKARAKQIPFGNDN
jgi:hypothetical protein